MERQLVDRVSMCPLDSADAAKGQSKPEEQWCEGARFRFSYFILFHRYIFVTCLAVFYTLWDRSHQCRETS